MIIGYNNINHKRVNNNMRKVIDFNTKSKILTAVREEGRSVKEASEEYGVSPKTIYAWLRGEVQGGDRNLILENNRLKKELDNCYRVIGRMSMEVKRPKG